MLARFSVLMVRPLPNRGSWSRGGAYAGPIFGGRLGAAFPANPGLVAAAGAGTYLKLQQLSYALGGFRTAPVFARLPL